MRRFVVALFIVILFLLSLSLDLSAAAFDPSSRWRTIETKHFRIHYPQALDGVAQRAMEISEEVYPDLVKRWDWKPWGYIEIVLTDNSDHSNGLATVFPYNELILWITPPSADISIGHYDDWLRTLISHELTHIIQIDGAQGFMRVPRVIFGKLVAPSGLDPNWMKEGIAQIEETRLTEGGRGRGSYSEMVVRASVLDNAFPPLDIADGLSWRWPAGSTAYIYGLKFIDHLIQKYGEEKFHLLDKRIRRSPLLFMLNHQAKNVYGKTFGILWREWHDELVQKYSDLKAGLEKEKLTELEPVIEQKKDDQLYSPAISPDGKMLAYSLTSPHHGPQIRVKHLEDGRDLLVVKDKSALNFSWSNDGKRLLFAEVRKYKTYYRYYDLWMYDFDKKKIKKLTYGLRARDPEFSRDGKSILFVLGKGIYEQLAVLNVDDDKPKAEVILNSDGGLFAFSNPRYSNDGKFFAVSRHDARNGWRIYIHNSDGSGGRRLTSKEGLVIESHAAWSNSDKEIFFSSDEGGIANIYVAQASGGKVQRITNVVGGLFNPTTFDGREIYVRSYSSKGFSIAKFKNTRSPSSFSGFPPEADPPLEETRESSKFELKYKPQKYVSFGRSLFLPRYISPLLTYSNDAFYIGGLTGGMDPLLWHIWNGGVLYRTDAKHMGYFFDYVYNRFRPVFRTGVNEISNAVSRFQNGDLYFEEYLTGYASAIFKFDNSGFPFKDLALAVGYYYSDHTTRANLDADSRDRVNLGRFAGANFALEYSDARKYPASISQEKGQRGKVWFTVTDSFLGSADKNEQMVLVGDLRKYLRLYKHHALALRVKGGMTFRDKIWQNTFSIGGAPGEGLMAANASPNYFSLRGLPYSSFPGERAVLMSGEYRMPLLSAERGYKTLPIFLREIHGAVFADYGNAWYDTRGFTNFFDDFMLGIGAELRANFVVGHALPIDGRLGYAILVVNRNRLGTVKDPITNNEAKYGVVVLEFGTSF